MTLYPQDRLYEEMAYLAYHFHWSAEEVLQLAHCDRQRWVEEVARINERFNREGSGRGSKPFSNPYR